MHSLIREAAKLLHYLPKSPAILVQKLGGGMCQNPFQAILRKELFCGFPIWGAHKKCCLLASDRIQRLAVAELWKSFFSTFFTSFENPGGGALPQTTPPPPPPPPRV